jgi:hypothetical protein
MDVFDAPGARFVCPVLAIRCRGVSWLSGAVPSRAA